MTIDRIFEHGLLLGQRLNVDIPYYKNVIMSNAGMYYCSFDSIPICSAFINQR